MIGTADEADTREAMVAACRAMNALGINQGSSGNISVRHGERMLLTPSGVPYDRLGAGDIVRMDMAGGFSGREGLRPSSEWRIHRDILAGRADAGAVVHAHPTYAIAISIMRREIPAIHYMIALAGGSSIRVAPYALFGSQKLSRVTLAALAGRRACLLAHHGMVAVGTDLGHAMALAVEVETLARQYHACLQLGEPPLLSEADIADALEQFRTGYGAAPAEPEPDAR